MVLYATTIPILPQHELKNLFWTNTGGAADTPTALRDGSDATYLSQPAGGSGQESLGDQLFGPIFVGTTKNAGSAILTLGLTLPTVKANDVGLVIMSGDVPFGTVTPPAGWTLVGVVAGVGAGEPDLRVYRKVLVLGDSGLATTWSWTVSSGMQLISMVYRGIDTANPVELIATTRSTSMAFGVTIPTSNNATRLPGMAVQIYQSGFPGFWDVKPTATDLFERSDYNSGGTLTLVTEEQVGSAAGTVARTATAGTTDRWNSAIVILRAALSVPANAKIYGVRSNFRLAEPSANTPASFPANYMSVGQRRDSTIGGTINVVWDRLALDPGATPLSWNFGFRDRNPLGTEWTPKDLANLILVLNTYQQTANLNWRIYELSADVAINYAPTVTITLPGASVTDTTRPAVTWTFSDAEGDAQEAYQVYVYTDAATTALGFTIGQTTGLVASSGVVVSSSSRSWTPTTDLTTGVAYRVYVRARQNWWTGDHWSAWVNTAFTITLDLPAPPTLTATYINDASSPRVQLVVQGNDNLLSTNQASLETDTSGWTAGTNSVLSRSTTQFAHGVASLRIDSVAAGDTSASTAPKIAVAPGVTYTFSGRGRSAVTARNYQIGVNWYDAAGAFISGSLGATVSAPTTAFVTAWVTAVAPANAVTAEMVVWFRSNGGAVEVHYSDAHMAAIGKPYAASILPANQSSFETDTSLWGAGANTALARSTAQAYSGAASLQMTNIVGTGDVSAFTAPKAAVTVGLHYRASAWFRAAATTRSVRVELSWYTAGSVLISTVTGTSAVDSATGWVQVTAEGVAPDTATQAAVVVRAIGTALAEVHYVDFVELQPLLWSRGGLASLSYFQIRYSDDGGVTWQQVPFFGTSTFHSGSTTQALTIEDYTPASGVTRQYRVYTAAASPIIASTPATASVSPVFSDWWLKDLATWGERVLKLPMYGDEIEISDQKNMEELPVLASAPYVVDADAVVKGERMQLRLIFQTAAGYTTFRAMRTSGHTLLLASPWGEQWWVQLGTQRTTNVKITPVRTADPLRVVTVDAVQVSTPGQ